MEIRVRDACQRCEGKGVFHHPGCGKCASLFDGDFNKEDPFLPCGHARIEYTDEWTCLDCMGTGKVESWITVQEWVTKVQGIQSSSGIKCTPSLGESEI